MVWYNDWYGIMIGIV